jgi:hypothetical protein
MKSKMLLFIAVLLLTFSLTELRAQESISASGGDASGKEGSVSFTIGQIFCKSMEGIDNSLTEGVQQAYEISVLKGNEQDSTQILASVYPNPATDYVNLKIEMTSLLDVNSIQYQLCDLNGKVIETQMLSSNIIHIVMVNLKPASYFVKLVQKNRIIKVFKIIKR